MEVLGRKNEKRMRGEQKKAPDPYGTGANYVLTIGGVKTCTFREEERGAALAAHFIRSSYSNIVPGRMKFV